MNEHNLSPEKGTRLARSLVGRAEVVVYVIVAILLLIELGVDAGLILAIALAVLIIHRYTLGRRSAEQK